MNSSSKEPADLSIPVPSDRLAGWMSRWYGLLRTHRMILTAVLVLLGLALGAASKRIIWQSSLLNFFSAHSSAIHDLQLAQTRNGLADAMRLDVHFAAGHNGDLRAAVTALGQSLRHTRAFSTVWSGASEFRQLRAQASLGKLAPILLSHQQLAILRHRVSSTWLRRHFQRQVRAIAEPQGQISAEELQSDPLNMRQLIFRRLGALSPASGAHFSGSLLVSGNGRHAMMILAPPFKAENVAASKRMLAIIRAAIAGVRKKMPGLRVWMVGPYRNFVENQRLVERDLKMISIVGTLLVAGAIAFYFRRIGAVVLCMIPPLVGLGTALGIAGILRLHIPLIVLGFDGLLCGATTDYGIQLMAAMNRMVRHSGRFDSTMPARAARELFGPISMSVCTSMTGYGALAASSAPGLRELGLFIAGATGCIWLVTFLVLPAYLGPWVVENRPATAKTLDDTGIAAGILPAARDPHESRAQVRRPHPRLSRRALKIGMTVAFILATLWLATRAVAVRYTTHGRSLDGSSARLKHDEAMFARVWGHLRNSGVLTIHQRNADLALRELQKLNHELAVLKAERLIAGYTTVADLLPDAQIVQRRLAAWRLFWNPARIAHVHSRLASAAAATGLRASAFDAVVKSWQSPVRVGSALRRLRESPATLLPGAVEIAPGNISISSTVELNTSLTGQRATLWAAQLRHMFPGMSIICGKVLYLNASHHAQVEALRLFPWVALVIVIPMWIYFRRLDVTVIAALSLGIGFIWLLGAAQWLGGGLNLLSLVPMLFTMGVAVDYGIYAASDPAQRRGGSSRDNRNSATFLCAATTILGTAAMIPAQHPVLHWIGITLTAGILGGYLASYFIVGPLVRMVLHAPAGALWRSLHQTLGRTGWMVALLVILMMVIGISGGCCSIPALPAYTPPMEPPPTSAAVRHTLAKFPRRWRRQFFAEVNWRGHHFSMIGQLTGDASKTWRVTCATEFGTLLCDIRVNGTKVNILRKAADFPDSLARAIGTDIVSALQLPLNVPLHDHRARRGDHTLTLNCRNIRYEFASAAGYLRVIQIKDGARNMEIQYQQYRHGIAPHKLVIWDAGHCLLMTIDLNAGIVR